MHEQFPLLSHEHPFLSRDVADHTNGSLPEIGVQEKNDFKLNAIGSSIA